jgi:hypothetical protein
MALRPGRQKQLASAPLAPGLAGCIARLRLAQPDMPGSRCGKAAMSRGLRAAKKQLKKEIYYCISRFIYVARFRKPPAIVALPAEVAAMFLAATRRAPLEDGVRPACLDRAARWTILRRSTGAGSAFPPSG